MSGGPDRLRRRQIVFCVVLLAVFVAMAAEARTFRPLAMRYPLFTALAGITLIGVMVVAFVVSSIGSRRPMTTHDDGDNGRALFEGLRWFGLFIGFALLTWLVGLLFSAAGWVFVWFTVIHPLRLWPRVAATAVITVALYGLIVVAGVKTPPGVLWPGVA